MKLYKVSQSHDTNYDTFDSAIVAAKDEAQAKTIHPGSWADSASKLPDEWQNPDLLTVELIGTAIRGTKAGAILGSFNAG